MDDIKIYIGCETAMVKEIWEKSTSSDSGWNGGPSAEM